MKQLLLPAALTFSALLAPPALAQAADAPKADPLQRARAFTAAMKSAEKKTQALMRWGDLDGLERLYSRAPDPRETGSADFDLPEQQFQVAEAVVALRPDDPSNDRAFENQQRLMEEWAQRRPGLALAHVGFAGALSGQAWAIRGNAYVRETRSDSMARFKTLSRKALDYLQANRKLIESERAGRIRMLWTLRDAGKDLDEIWSTAQGYLRKDPEQWDIYPFLGTALSPRWGGSAEALDYAARESVKLTRAKTGFEAYARIYIAAEDIEYGAGLFTQSLAKWPEMKQGLEDILKRRPTVWTHHKLAYFACLAKDRETLRRQLDLLGDDLKSHSGDWGRNGARTQAECQRFAAEI